MTKVRISTHYRSNTRPYSVFYTGGIPNWLIGELYSVVADKREKYGSEYYKNFTFDNVDVEEAYQMQLQLNGELCNKITKLEQELALIKEQTAIQEVTYGEEEKKIIPFPKLKLLTGGKGPPDGGWSTRWINDLEEGSLFLVRNKINSADFVLHRFLLIVKNDEGAYLIQNINGQDMHVWVDIARFCRSFDIVTILEVLKKPEEYELEGEKEDLEGEKEQIDPS